MAESERLSVRDDGNTVSRVEQRKRERGDEDRSKAARELIAVGHAVLSYRFMLSSVFALVAMIEVGVGYALMTGGSPWYWQPAGGGIIVAGVLTAYFVYWINTLDNHSD